ncbi:hypothetical protein SpiGrapes_2749 [Sphaerochaeta pleomorpha str. Grapes]|uniref:Uncharacterized protein n=1 Tax=Sphaerochaeta pleomorpha (strain ATCC BAA-1885 / DSM 22778 / Grapes) TaxID=158190 RepID=G8QVY2_SPHPG|nr:hypothetical protein [Sphaerochaeta pleomorpha]AEV30506.1 hypothetical protein SpiGrapes_2749 [Sphaerochaeta pleomorpha str. Grapes]
MKKILVLLLAALLCSSLFAKPTANDVTVALAAITDSSICAVAAFLNNPKLELPGCQLFLRDGETLPYAISFSDSDIGTYLPLFQAAKKPAGTSFLDSLLNSAKGPLNDIALQYLTVHDWKLGHAHLDGVAVPYFGESSSLNGLMSAVMMGAPPTIAVATDVTIKGTRVSEPVRVEGVFLIHNDEDGYFEVKPVQLKINGVQKDV